MCLTKFYASSIGKKQIVAVTGLCLILYVVAHLAGNLLIYIGPDMFNGYAKFLASLRPGLYIVEALLFVIFIAHFYVTGVLVMENRKARGGPSYTDYRNVGNRSVATQLMPYTGTILLIFVMWHIYDFTLIDHEGPRSILRDGLSHGLYGVVYNAFCDPLHGAFYIVAMASLGLHLSHGIKSMFQTFGVETEQPRGSSIGTISNLIGIIIAVSYSTIPIYVFLNNSKFYHVKF